MIRAYQPGKDFTAVARLIRNELIPLSHTVQKKNIPTDAELAARLSEGKCYVSCSKGRPEMPDAFIHIVAVNDTLHVDMLAVSAASQGRQIGRKLMVIGEAYGIAEGCRTARLLVDFGNERAHRFYDKLGYQTIRYHPQLACFELAKTLPALAELAASLLPAN
ncbi:GNAT family N-acetyltransferase [Paenibacillus tarimensis]|uniref:GNAT family N-acetyltransferase n=1 Tax=Paenibacillus tarimensis TaxID=416012 RepID=UPI001F3D2DB0|nr:GNAT family N-acetyltransferase [Paenibacillus tarimensis]MCF2942839.1 GNAT family N-acetyltransferase [Paenibacillus tarimensis]